jgi:predicted  nucleic acid-binding Zn-ribbon protein
MAEINSDLVSRIEKLTAKKTELETTKGVKDKSLVDLDAEIKQAGHDPLKLPEKIKTTQDRITKFEAETVPKLEEIEGKVATLENNEHSSEQFNGFD